MGKPTGFKEYSRQLPGKEPAISRLQHHNEFVGKYAGQEVNEQAARCMDCGVPFCHSGCPLGNVIPEFNEAVYQKNWKEAYDILVATNNFPEFTGRICPAPCESACVLGINEQPVAIEEIERHIVETAFEKGLVIAHAPLVRSGKKVAVIGSGPAGLAVAAQLNSVGHTVVVYERDDKPGGLLRYGIPDFKLEKNIVDRRLRLLEEEGIQFQCHSHVGININVNDLLREFHAIVLAGGATIPRDLNVPGRSAKGIHFAMQYLKQQNKRNASLGTLEHREIESNIVEADIIATDKDVIVIGGGDTGSDCIGTAHRQGARSVTQLEVLPKPPGQRDGSMPWPSFPLLLKTTSSHEEGGERHWAVATKEFIFSPEGCLTGIRLIDLEWRASQPGIPAQFSEVVGTERQINCQLVLLAIGFLHPQQEGLLRLLEIETDDRGNVKAGATDFKTNLPKVFAAGDMRRGQSLVVWAISEGRECARKVDEYLSGASLLEKKDCRLSFHQIV